MLEHPKITGQSAGNQEINFNLSLGILRDSTQSIYNIKL